MSRRSYDPLQREALVRAVLEASPDLPHATLARQLDMARESVRRVRIGLLWANVAPDLERLDPGRVTRSCQTCRLFDHHKRKAGGSWRYGRCSLGYPEADENHHWARSCEAYAHDPTAPDPAAPDPMPSPAPATPRADAFRLGDVWRGPDGRSYTVCRGPLAHMINLHPAGLSARITLRRTHVEGFQRVSWGGEW